MRPLLEFLHNSLVNVADSSFSKLLDNLGLLNRFYARAAKYNRFYAQKIDFS